MKVKAWLVGCLSIIALFMSAGSASAQPCVGFEWPVEVGELALEALSESSGLVVSRKNPGVLWTHNDSGDDAIVYAAALDGRHLARVSLIGIEARDWEDISVGPCGEDTCLYVGDIGDNNHERNDLKLVRFVEPALDPNDPEAEPLEIVLQSSDFELLPFSYEDGMWDAESLMVHPVNGQIFIVTKVLTGASGLYTLSWGEGAATATRLAEATFGAIPLIEQSTTGAEFNPEGSHFVVRTYTELYDYHLDGRGVAEAFAATPTASVEVQDEEQGEAVAYGPDGRSLWTTTEGDRAIIHEYTCRDTKPDQAEPTPDEAEPAPDQAEPTPDQAEPTPDQAEALDPRDDSTSQDFGAPSDDEALDPAQANNQPDGACCSQIRCSQQGSTPSFALLFASSAFLAWAIRR